MIDFTFITNNELLYLLIYESATDKIINEIIRILNISKQTTTYNTK